MEQRPRQLLTSADLKTWLQVSDQWVKDRLAQPDFVERCVVDLAPEGSSRRTLRYAPHAVAEFLGIPLPPEADVAAAQPRRAKAA